MKITQLTILFLLLSIYTSYGQEDCATKLSRAQKQYDAGQIEEIQQLLQPCIKDGFNKEEIQTAQKLIIQTNLFDKNSNAADSAMLQFLKKYPEYEIVPSDQAEFVQLFNTYQNRPVAAVGIIGGANYLFAFNNGAVSADPYSYTQLMSIHGGIALRKAIKNNFDISIDGLYQQSKYKYTGTNEDATTTTLTETQSSIMLPISIIYIPFQFSKLSLFARAGATIGYMIGSTGELSTTTVGISTLSNLSLIDLRNPFQIFGLVGLGLNYKLAHSYIQFDIKYNHGFMEQVSNEVAPKLNDEFINPAYNYPINGLKVSNLAISLGWYYKFYIPRKK